MAIVRNGQPSYRIVCASAGWCIRSPLLRRDGIRHRGVGFSGFAPTYYMKFFGDGARATVSGVVVYAPRAPAWRAVHCMGAPVHYANCARRESPLEGAPTVWAWRAQSWRRPMIPSEHLIGRRATGKRGAPHRWAWYPLAFLAIPIFDMVLFATFVTAALVLRRNKEVHKRLMLLASISIIVAAVARLPGLLLLGPLAFFGLGYSLVVVAAIYDLASLRRVHKAVISGAGR